eukprot:scaffold513_cov71-Phaeocystis_antarctica.AAC.2
MRFCALAPWQLYTFVALRSRHPSTPAPQHPCAPAPLQVCAAGAILNLLGPSLGVEDPSNAKRQGFKKLLSLALTVGMLNDALRADQTQMDPTASKPART